MKNNFLDVTFLIPVKIDSLIRLENLLLTVRFIKEQFDTHIIVLESAPYPNGIIQSILEEDIEYVFVQDDDPIYHKTKYLNLLTKRAITNIVSIWDADIIIPYEQIIRAVESIRKNDYDVAYPYDGNFLDTSFILRKHYFIYHNIDIFLQNKGKMKSLYTFEGIIGAVGGAVFIKREKYIFSGMENESFYGWGLEDGERHYRWLGFGFKIYRSPGCLFHLSHPRDINGHFYSETQKVRAHHSLNEVMNYTKEEMIERFSIQPAKVMKHIGKVEEKTEE